jgi:hypothetical protein
MINKADFARILVGYLSRRSCKKTWQAVKGTESNERAHVYTLKLMDGRMDKRVAYIYIGCESSLLLLNYCKEGIKYEEQKNLAMDVHYKEPIPDAKSHMFAHPFFFTDPCAPGLHKTYTSKVFFARWICMRS